MSKRYKGGVLSSSLISTSSSSASGMWTLPQQMIAISANKWQVPTVLIDYLVVAGGGGGANTGSGGGAGGLLTSTNYSLPFGTHTITVGAGGSGSTHYSNQAPNGGNGYESSIGSLISTVGGGGGMSHGNTSGQNGGSGSGAPTTTTGSVPTAGKGIYPGSTYVNGPRQGYDGGPGSLNSSWNGLIGGGGGAGGTGLQPNGGPGLASSITGTSTSYGGGGGSGSVYAATGSGGTGGGGSCVSGIGTAGTANTGGGGGGGQFRGSCGTNYCGGGAGGSGVVIIRTLATASATTGSPTITTDGSYNIYKFTGSGSITF